MAAPSIFLGTRAVIDTTWIYTYPLIHGHGLATTWELQWGLTTLYGSSQTGSISASLATVFREAVGRITGLTPLRTYHLKWTATNADGTATTGDFTLFTQLPLYFRAPHCDADFLFKSIPADFDLATGICGRQFQLPIYHSPGRRCLDEAHLRCSAEELSNVIFRYDNSTPVRRRPIRATVSGVDDVLSGCQRSGSTTRFEYAAGLDGVYPFFFDDLDRLQPYQFDGFFNCQLAAASVEVFQIVDAGGGSFYASDCSIVGPGTEQSLGIFHGTLRLDFWMERGGGGSFAGRVTLGLTFPGFSSAGREFLGEDTIPSEASYDSASNSLAWTVAGVTLTLSSPLDKSECLTI